MENPESERGCKALISNFLVTTPEKVAESCAGGRGGPFRKNINSGHIKMKGNERGDWLKEMRRGEEGTPWERNHSKWIKVIGRNFSVGNICRCMVRAGKRGQ